jgi:hypothetical protein
VSGALTDSTTGLWIVNMPDSVVITVLGPDGGSPAEIEQPLGWERVDGIRKCGGPMEAVVVVPAP